MSRDPLYEALGTRARDAAPTPRRALWRWIGIALLLALVGGVAALTLRPSGRGSDLGIAVARIETAPKPQPQVTTPAPPPAAAPAPTVTDQVEIQHGVKIIRLTPASSSASIRVAVPENAPLRLAVAPDPRLVETSRFGPLPRTGVNGARPAEVYARPLAAPVAPGAPRIALVVGGMGLDQLLTAQAARRLPPAVTLGFPPDGPDLMAQVAEARAAGHEVVLQLPAALPDAAPSGETALDRLHRAMAKYVGYAGVTLPPGSGDDAASVRHDVARRGLYAIDAAEPAEAGTGRLADVVIAATDDGPAAAEALARLAAIARTKGSALGLIMRQGSDLDATAAFAGGLAGQAIDLVPASALADSGRAAATATK